MVSPSKKTPLGVGGQAGKSKLGAGRAGQKRFSRRIRKPFLTMGDFKRLARRGGVKRISQNSYTAVRECLATFLYRILSDAMSYTSVAQRKTIIVNDIEWASRRYGRIVYGIH